MKKLLCILNSGKKAAAIELSRGRALPFSPRRWQWIDWHVPVILYVTFRWAGVALQLWQVGL